MSEYKEIKDSVEVPTTAGIEGFFLALRKILRLPRVTDLHVGVGPKIKVTFTRYAREEEPSQSIEVDFDSVAPGALVRNLEMQELDVYVVRDNAAVCLSSMFYAAAVDHMYPIAFVAGARSVLPDWHFKTTGVRLGPDGAYGLPLHRDRHIPDETLILVAAYSRDAGLVDARKAYKIAMPDRQAPVRVVSELVLDTVQVMEEGTPLVAAGTPAGADVKDPS